MVSGMSAGAVMRQERAKEKEREKVVSPAGSLEQRVVGALRVLWSLSKDGEPKAIVAKLATEFKGSMGRPRVTPTLMRRLASAQALVGLMNAQPRSLRDTELLGRLDKALDDILTECAG
jgi:hypothetical protein